MIMVYNDHKSIQTIIENLNGLLQLENRTMTTKRYTQLRLPFGVSEAH